MSAAAERLTSFTCAVGESPVWRVREGALYWVDIPKRLLHRLRPATGQVDSWRTEEMVACIAFDRAGGIVAGMESGIFSLSLAEDGTAAGTRLASVSHAMGDMRFNDGRCDRQGRFWAGTMHMDIPAAHAVGALYRYDSKDGLSEPVQDGLLVQNGIAFSPAGDRMYLSDSHAQARVIWQFDYDTDIGMPRNRRVFVDMRKYIGRPDGAAVDADGCYWTCAADAGRVMRFTPDGILDRMLQVPAVKPTMCAFGGEGLDTLFVTSLRPAPEQQPSPEDGAVFALRPGVPGLPEPEFEQEETRP